MSDTPRDPDQDDDATARVPRSSGHADTSHPADSTPDNSPYGAESRGWGSSAPASGSDPHASSAVGSAAPTSGAGPTSSAGSVGSGGAGSAARGGRRPAFSIGPVAKTPEEQQRRRRRWWVAGISIGAAVVVIALCVGSLAVISAVSGVRDRAGDARETRALKDQSCLDFERRLNRLTPPGATTTPNARAAAIRNEDAALRIYLNEVTDDRSQDAWRRILDSRTVYADLLERLAKSPSAPFYLPPKNDTGVLLTDELADWSPASCAGPIHRLAAPDL